MPNEPAFPQLGNVPVMYLIILYRNMYLYRTMPGLLISQKEMCLHSLASVIGPSTKNRKNTIFNY
jgi:hypothetical protein